MRQLGLGARPKFEIIGMGTGVGQTVTPVSGSKGSYATIGTTTFRYNKLQVMINGPTRRERIDIAMNNGGSDTIIIPDIGVTGGDNISNNQHLYQSITFPIRVPSGAVLKARAWSSASGGACDVFCAGYGGNQKESFSKAISCTDFTGTDPPTVTQTNTTFTAWTAFCASTSKRIKGLIVRIADAADATRTPGVGVVEIARGSAGNEVIIGIVPFSQSAGGTYADTKLIECDIPAGTRLSMRCQCAGGAMADSIGIIGYGLVV